MSVAAVIRPNRRFDNKQFMSKIYRDLIKPSNKKPVEKLSESTAFSLSDHGNTGSGLFSQINVLDSKIGDSGLVKGGLLSLEKSRTPTPSSTTGGGKLTASEEVTSKTKNTDLSKDIIASLTLLAFLFQSNTFISLASKVFPKGAGALMMLKKLARLVMMYNAKA